MPYPINSSFDILFHLSSVCRRVFIRKLCVHERSRAEIRARNLHGMAHVRHQYYGFTSYCWFISMIRYW